VVHVLTKVLRKIHQSLRVKGSLLIIQPTSENSTIQLEVEGNTKFSEELKEPNFLRYLEATSASIGNIVSEGLFVIEDEAITPDEGSYHSREYESLDEWVEDHKPFCEDLEAFNAMSVKIRNIAGKQQHRILEYWREDKVLLRRS
jgi:hypothetical protein